MQGGVGFLPGMALPTDASAVLATVPSAMPPPLPVATSYNPLAVALALAKLAWQVFPCHSATKQPTFKGGYKNASTDEATIRRMWDEHYGGIVGVATGAVSNLAVIDLDTYKHPEAAEWFEANRAALPATFTVRTRSGGVHLYFQQHPGLRISQSAFCEGVDIRADGGYVIYWPDAGGDIIDNSPLAPFPEWVADLLAGGNRRKKQAKVLGQSVATVDTNQSGERLDVDAAIAQIKSGDGGWHLNGLRVVGSWVARGRSDAEIQADAAAWTTDGYTPEQTRDEVQAMIDGARTKGLSLDKRVMFRAVSARRYNSIRRGSRRARC